MDEHSRTSPAAVVAALLVLIGLAGAVVFVAGVIFTFFAGLPPAQEAALLTALIGGAASIFAIYLNRRADRASQLAGALRPRKAEV